MCTVSMIGDHYRDRWTDPHWHDPAPAPVIWQVPMPPAVSREEFDLLKREVLEMKDLLKRAKEYDARNNEPDCEVDEKMDLLRKVAKLVGVNLDDVLGAPPHAQEG